MAELLLILNPETMDEPVLTKTLTYSEAIGPGGSTVSFEGQDQYQTIQWTGKILDQAQYDQFVTVFNTRETQTFIDDLGRTYTVYITGFAPKRVHTVSNPYYHEYTMTMIVVSTVEPV